MSLDKERHLGIGQDGICRAVIFCFFVAGSVLANLFDISIYTNDTAWLYILLLYCAPLAAGLFLSSSLQGTALLPFCALFYGLVLGQTARSELAKYVIGEQLDIKLILIAAICIPVFFIVSVGGMQISAMLNAALEKNGLSAKAKYMKEYIPLIVIVLAALLAVFFING